MNESADYRLYNEVADYVENELIVKASQQVKSGTTRLQYQSLVIDIAAKFNSYIHSNGKNEPGNPIYEYFNKHTIAPNLAMPSGTNPLGTVAFITFGDILWKLCDTEDR